MPNGTIIFVTMFMCFVHESKILDSAIFQKHPIPFLKNYEPLNLTSSNLHPNVKMEKLIKRRRQHNLHNRKVDFEFFAFRQHFHIVAEPVINSTIAFDAIIQFYDANSSIVSKLYDLDIELYSGALTDVPGSSVMGYFNKGIFQSIIVSNERIYNIEPAFNYIKNRVYFNAIIYRDSDIITPKNSSLKCNNCEKIQRQILNPERLKIGLDNFSSTRKVCTLELVIDYTLYNLDKNLHSYLLHEMSTYVQFADKIFRNADFNRNSLPDNIGLQLKKITIFKHWENENYPFKNIIGQKNVDASDLLQAAESYKNDFCLIHFFVHRSFKHVRGEMARIGGIDGNGICMNFRILKVSKNTGITTTRIGRGIRPRLELALSFAHSIGHGFGAFHDPKTNSSDPNNVNPFLMHDSINPNSKNKILFSNFSIESISSVIHKRGPWCLINLEEPKCGNGLTELGEECDCGPKEDCDKVDPNCAPEGSLVDPPCFIRRSQNKSCSARESPCCSADGQIVSANEYQVCNSFLEQCHDMVYCDGWSAECDRRILVANGEYCAGYSRTCLFGICEGSICIDRFHLEECECESNPCDICCMRNKKCQSLTELRVGSIETILFRKHFGEFCLNGTGYCSVDSECVLFRSKYQALFPIRSIPFLIYLIPLLLLILFCLCSMNACYFYSYKKRWLVMNFEKLIITFEEEWKEELDSFDECYKKNLIRLGVLFPTVPFEAFSVMLKEIDERTVAETIISSGIPIRKDFSKNLKIPSRKSYKLSKRLQSESSICLYESIISPESPTSSSHRLVSPEYKESKDVLEKSEYADQEVFSESEEKFESTDRQPVTSEYKETKPIDEIKEEKYTSVRNKFKDKFKRKERTKIQDFVEPKPSGFKNLFASKRVTPDKFTSKKLSESVIQHIPMITVMPLPGQTEEYSQIQHKVRPETTELAVEYDLTKEISSDDRRKEDLTEMVTDEETVPFPKSIITEDSSPLHKTQIIPKEELIFKTVKSETLDTTKSDSKIPGTTTMPKYFADEFIRKHAVRIQKPDSSLLDTESEPEMYILKKDSPEEIIFEKMEIPPLKFVSKRSLPSSRPIPVSVITPSTSKFEIKESSKPTTEKSIPDDDNLIQKIEIDADQTIDESKESVHTDEDLTPELISEMIEDEAMSFAKSTDVSEKDEIIVEEIESLDDIKSRRSSEKSADKVIKSISQKVKLGESFSEDISTEAIDGSKTIFTEESVSEESFEESIFYVESISSEESFKESIEYHEISKYDIEPKEDYLIKTLPEKSLITETIEESKPPSQKLESEETKFSEKLVAETSSVDEIAIDKSHLISDKVKPTSKNRLIKRLFSKDKFEREESQTSEEIIDVALSPDKVKAKSATEKESISVPYKPIESTSSKEYMEAKFIHKTSKEKFEPESKRKDKMPFPPAHKRKLSTKIVESLKPMPKMFSRVKKHFTDFIPKHLQYYGTPVRKEKIIFPDEISSEESSDSIYDQIMSEIESDTPKSKQPETRKLKPSKKSALPKIVDKKPVVSVSEEPGVSSLDRQPMSAIKLKRLPITKRKKVIDEPPKTQEAQRDLSEKKTDRKWKKTEIFPFWDKSDEPEEDIHKEHRKDLSTLKLARDKMKFHKYKGQPVPKPIGEEFLKSFLFGPTSFTREVTEDFKDRVTLAPPESLKIVTEKITKPFIIQPKVPLSVKIDDRIPTQTKQSTIKTVASEDENRAKSPVARSKFRRKRVKIRPRSKKQKVSPRALPEPKSPTKILRKRLKKITKRRYAKRIGRIIKTKPEINDDSRDIT